MTLDPKAVDAVFDVIWPQQDWNGEEAFCRAVAEKVVRVLSAAPSGQAPLEGVKPSDAVHVEGCEHSRSPVWLCDCPRPRLLPASAEPVAWMNADHVKDYRDKTADGIAWASPQQTVFYSVPLYASPPASGAVEAGWQPMESAPKDRPILGWNDHETAYICQWLYDEDGDGDWLEYGTDVVNPVRWMPLPAAPTEDR